MTAMTEEKSKADEKPKAEAAQSCHCGCSKKAHGIELPLASGKSMQVYRNCTSCPCTVYAPASASSGEKRPVEEHAKAAGMLPMWFMRNRFVNMGGKQRELAEAPKMNPSYWKFAAAKAAHLWADGHECTQAEFDSAIHKTCNSRIG